MYNYQLTNWGSNRTSDSVPSATENCRSIGVRWYWQGHLYDVHLWGLLNARDDTDTIDEAARKLNEQHEAWLNPSDLAKRVPEVVEGYPDRIVPVIARRKGKHKPLNHCVAGEAQDV
ncbi:hypothetical protein [Rhodovibrio salinarum]|uniref:hypothetical protein n=1 Tax=Rhodovibrio salinarum TaxID=1087 RepID=UPI0012DC8217|nr:hypothetical protein [Rhodovibrio salinarum]